MARPVPAGNGIEFLARPLLARTGPQKNALDFLHAVSTHWAFCDGIRPVLTAKPLIGLPTCFLSSIGGFAATRALAVPSPAPAFAPRGFPFDPKRNIVERIGCIALIPQWAASHLGPKETTS